MGEDSWLEAAYEERHEIDPSQEPPGTYDRAFRDDDTEPDVIFIEGEPYSYDEMMDSTFELDCGCEVEPDGVCEHGNPSPPLRLGLI